MRKFGAIILAAGSGTRYKEKKQDVLFHGKALWRYSYETTLKVLDESRVIVVGKDVPGGKTRTESVIIGLKALPSDTERVIIIDAARPMIKETQIREILENPNPSVTFVRPMINTPIYRDGRYVNRCDMYEMLVPQAFDYPKLLMAYESGSFPDMTDETRVMFEYYGILPTMIETENNLYKVTYPGDLLVIESIYHIQNQSNDND